MKKYLLLLLFVVQVSFAEWPCRSDQNVPIAVAAGNQWNARLTTDGHHGAIVVWQDRRGGSIDKLYIQHVNNAGDALWQEGGIQLSSSDGYQYNPDIFPDGEGGTFIVWQDNRNVADYDIYAQHVSADGQLLWGAVGVVVTSANGHQYNPKVVTDGNNGIVIVWQDKRGGQYDIYAQRLNSTGSALWQENGIVVCNEAADQLEPKLISSVEGAVIVTWTDYQGETGFPDVYAQKLLSDGSKSWASAGVPVCNATNAQYNVQIISDGATGAILCWQDRRFSSIDRIYAQRMDSAGSALWTSNGVQLSISSGIQYYPRIASDGTGGAVVVWQDNRRGNDFDIFSQRINADGTLMWTSAGQAVVTATGHQYNPQVVVDKASVLMSWQDKRNGSNYDIFVQRLNLNGQITWGNNGIPVVSSPSDQILPEIISDLVEGIIICWADYRSGTGFTDLYAHRMGANGKLAGGCYRTFTQENYSVRSVKYHSRLRGAFGLPNAGNVRDSIFRRGLDPSGLTIGVDRSDSVRRYGWMVFTRRNHVRRALPQIGPPRPFTTIGNRLFVGPKRNYSSIRYNNAFVGDLISLKLNIAASDVGLTDPGFGDLKYFDPVLRNHPVNNRTIRDIAKYADSLLTMWRKYTDVNYAEVDSLLKKINSAFTGIMDTNSSVPLSIKSTAPVFTVPFLIPGTEQHNEAILNPSTKYFDELPSFSTLLQNYPNPFNPFTTIEFNLPEPSYVTLKVYNTLGQEVASLAENTLLEEGDQLVDFDGSNVASGVYFYRLTVQSVSSGSLYALINKMLLIK
jgi:hypothetical protein